MSFQPSAFFQPEPKPHRQRFRRWKQLVYHFKAAPFLSPLEQSAWQRGYTDVPGWTRRRPVLVQAATTIAGCGFGLTLGSTWWERGLFGALVALGVFLAGLVSIWLWHSLTAPVKQRTEAREYAQALKEYADDYAQWARRREIAYDFRHDTLLHDVVRFRPEEEGGPTLMASLADEEVRWRSILANISAQMEANGGDVSAFMQAQLAFLDNADGSFPGDELALIRNSMLQACQNLLAEVRQEGPPTAPAPPSGSDQ
jgi:hypothetical protein